MSRHALRAHQLKRCPVRLLRAQVHATASQLGLKRRGPGELERIAEELADTARPAALAFEELDEPGCRRKRALHQP